MEHIAYILPIILFLTVVTNIIVQVIKSVTWDKIPTNLLALIVAFIVTAGAAAVYITVMAIAFKWYMVIVCIAIAFCVAFAAMFGFDKLKQMFEQIEGINTIKEARAMKLNQ